MHHSRRRPLSRGLRDQGASPHCSPRVSGRSCAGYSQWGRAQRARNCYQPRWKLRCPKKQVNLARGGLLSEFAYASPPHCRRWAA